MWLPDYYIRQLSELMDQLTTYEPNPDLLHYITRFVDGLKHDVHMIVVVQRPEDLDIACAIASP